MVPRGVKERGAKEPEPIGAESRAQGSLMEKPG